MPITVLGGTKLADTTFSVANSCRFNQGDGAYMHKTIGSAGNLDRWTFSCWVKRGNLADTEVIFAVGAGNAGGGSYGVIKFSSTDTIEWENYPSDTASGILKTSRKFRDCSAWYHFVFVWDSGNATAGNRMRMYTNGVEETSFSNDSNPDQNQDNVINNAHKHEIGAMDDAYHFDGYLAEVVFIDGTAYAASDFGEFDSDSPTIWKPIDVSGITFGTNGFYLDFEASDNLGNDANGGTDLTEDTIAAVDQCTDSPTNNFCTMNPLRLAGTLSEGNCTYTPTATAHTCEGTMGITAGKWYWEVRCSNSSVNLGLAENGISVIGNNDDNYPSYTAVAGTSTTWTIYNNVSSGNNSTTHTGTQVSNSGNDIIMVGFDADNENLYFGVNGTWEPDGADPTSGASATGASITSIQARYGGTLIPIAGVSGAVSRNWDYNFGNPSWGLSSAVNDANGYGNFEFAPPSGYFALCSKNLAEYGG